VRPLEDSEICPPLLALGFRGAAGCRRARRTVKIGIRADFVADQMSPPASISLVSEVRFSGFLLGGPGGFFGFGRQERF